MVSRYFGKAGAATITDSFRRHTVSAFSGMDTTGSCAATVIQNVHKAERHDEILFIGDLTILQNITDSAPEKAADIQSNMRTAHTLRTDAPAARPPQAEPM